LEGKCHHPSLQLEASTRKTYQHQQHQHQQHLHESRQLQVDIRSIVEPRKKGLKKKGKQNELNKSPEKHLKKNWAFQKIKNIKKCVLPCTQ
jgi:hypothetical protein